MKYLLTTLFLGTITVAFSQGVVSEDNPIIIKRKGSYSPRQNIDDDEKLRMTGPTSDYIVAVQDGSGRVQHYWNATAKGNTSQYLSSSEPAGKILFHPAGSNFFTVSWAGSGTAGNNISWNEYFRISSSGNVGIGTTSPSEKLEVNGTIRSKEVKVESSPWPDYVFAEDYPLTTLEEVEDYIKENKHLPEVPSAEEVEENGIALGEMNALLLKKIEELTLYVIKQSKQLSQQQKANSQSQKKIEKLTLNQTTLLKRIEQLEKAKN